jgi:thioredoxin 1
MPPYMAESGPEPTREEVDALNGLAVVEFGASWCPHCQAVQASLKSELASRPEIRHIKVEDGKGKPLGRSFRVKLWPTLVFLRDGQVTAQMSRPADDELRQGFESLGAKS